VDQSSTDTKSDHKNIQLYKKRENIYKKELKKQHQKYEKLFHSAPIGIVQTTIQGKILTINQTMADILGVESRTEAEAIYRDLEKDLYAGTERRKEFLAELKDKGDVKNFEFRAKRKDESLIWLSMNAKISSMNPLEQNIDGDIIEAFIFDITKRKETELKLNEKQQSLLSFNEELGIYNNKIIKMNNQLDRSLNEISELNQRFIEMINLLAGVEDLSSYSEKEFMELMLQTAVDVVPEADYGSVYLYHNGKVEFIDSIGHDLSNLKSIDAEAESFYNHTGSIEIKKIDELVKRDASKFNEKTYEILNQEADRIKETIFVDLEFDGKKMAGLSLDIDADSEQNFRSNSKKIFKAFHNIASSFYNIKEYNYLHNKFTKELITSIIKLLEMYDMYTKGHSENVAELASEIAAEMGLSKEKVDDTFWAGMVHDIGKLLIPLEIINKNRKLTEEEYQLIKKHPILGSRAIKSSESLKHIAKYVKHHHERWDGKGYPDGLSKDEIPIVSQILQVADAWDAMMSRRSYRNELSEEKALEEIYKHKGTQFSPKVVEVFLKLRDNSTAVK